uniref:NB-ARC domain-containing protein n=1 Tax=Leersia perrieri TaxID=77586 RepID=A0A0D9V0R0_9ORYZ
MEVIVSAIMGELASRTISFLIDKYSERVTTAATEEERLDNLQRLLLRVRIIVEDAEERHVTNKAMLNQLNILRKEMYRGYYTLDTFKCRAHDVKERDQAVSYSFVLSKFNHAKRVCFCSDSGERVKELVKVVVCLETIIRDANEFIKFLKTYPRLSRQPYSMYLLLDKCMFGRQMEMECVISFLLQEEITYGADHLGVLPIIGPGKVGKSTLVEHACIDERVRNHFSQIVFFSKDGLTAGNIATLKDGGVTKHQAHALDGSERRLVVVELDGEIDQVSWERFYLASKSCFAYGSKIIITSRSDKIASFGTTQPLKLQFLTQEAFWYLFRVRAFGSSDPAENPKLASLAMDMASEVSGCFTSVNMFNGLLRSNANTSFWSFVLATIRGFKQRNLIVYNNANPVDPWAVVAPLYIPRANKNLTPVAILNNYQRGCNEAHNYSGLITASNNISAAPQITVQDIMFGTATPTGQFEVLAWRSHIPPYYSCVFDCEIKRPAHMVSRKKKSKKIAI